MSKFYPIPEWLPQHATLLVWPHIHSDWKTSLSKIEKTYLDLVKAITTQQIVIIVCFDTSHQAHVSTQCQTHHCNMANIEFSIIPTNDTWVRDFGPQFLKNKYSDGYVYLDFIFNAWGEKYSHDLDQVFSKTLWEQINTSACKYQQANLVLEGGNLDFDEDCNLLINLHCLQQSNTNTSVVEEIKSIFNANEIFALEVPPLSGDDTNGHIDTLARFINNDTIVIAKCSDTNNPNHATLHEVNKQINTLIKTSHKKYKIATVPTPKTIYHDSAGNILPANYINFLFINNSLLIPIYNDEYDAIALQAYKAICPEREVIGIDATELIQQFGSLHCATLQIPERADNECWYHSAKQFSRLK